MDDFAPYVVSSTHELVARAGAATADPNRPPVYKVVGLILAIASGLFIGSSFVLKKHGLLKANEKYDEVAGEGYGYLKNFWWWTGMTLMIVGEVCNFVAYAFTDAILVTPLGALSVVVTTILSAIFLKERLSFVGKVGCFNCIVGSVVIVLNAPSQSAVADIQEMKSYVIAPGFLSYMGVIIVGCAFVAFWVGPRYGKKSMLVYLSICSLIGGLSVVATQGLGAAVVAQAGGKAQFNQWFLYVLLVFVVGTLLTEIVYLNKALNLFNAALVTPTYYVFFTSATIVTSSVLFRGFKGTPLQIATVIMGFLQICSGVVLLQMSKSAKDVPDAAVFSGDLDQMREMAEQEQPESEPKADALRGTSAIIRRISLSRQKMEQEEARRLREDIAKDHLEPVREDEIVEWDGLRRRKTIVGMPSTRAPVRRQTIHPPLGMSRMPDPNEEEEDEGLFDAIRRRASTMVPRHARSAPNNDPERQAANKPVAMTNIQARTATIDSPATLHDPESISGRSDFPHGKPKDGAGITSQPMSPMTTAVGAKDPMSPTIRHVTEGRRQFSFSNFLNRNARTPSNENVPRRDISSRGGTLTPQNRNAPGASTEEERLGLVKVLDEKLRDVDDKNHEFDEKTEHLRAPSNLDLTAEPKKSTASTSFSQNKTITPSTSAKDLGTFGSGEMVRTESPEEMAHVRFASAPGPHPAPADRGRQTADLLAATDVRTGRFTPRGASRDSSRRRTDSQNRSQQSSIPNPPPSHPDFVGGSTSHNPSNSLSTIKSNLVADFRSSPSNLGDEQPPRHDSGDSTGGPAGRARDNRRANTNQSTQSYQSSNSGVRPFPEFVDEPGPYVTPNTNRRWWRLATSRGQGEKMPQEREESPSDGRKQQ